MKGSRMVDPDFDDTRVQLYLYSVPTTTTIAAWNLERMENSLRLIAGSYDFSHRR